MLGKLDWTRRTARMKVPPDARVAIVGIGLLGATGQLSCDELTIRAGGQPVRQALGARR